jgi:polysaccharide biosynthesis transport protein
LDLRRPRLHERLELHNDEGISELITSDRSVEQVIQQVPIKSNLYALTSGKTPPDPIRLLSSRKMQELIQYLETQFDLVIYDMPPMLDLSDVNLIAPQTDGLVFVVGLCHSRRVEVKRAIEALHMTPTPLLGVVANGSQQLSSNHSTYLTLSDAKIQHPSLPESSTTPS